MAELERAEAPPSLLAKGLELDGQAVAVPTRDIVDLAAPQDLEAVPDVLQDLGREGGAET